MQIGSRPLDSSRGTARIRNGEKRRRFQDNRRDFDFLRSGLWHQRNLKPPLLIVQTVAVAI